MKKITCLIILFSVLFFGYVGESKAKDDWDREWDRMFNKGCRDGNVANQGDQPRYPNNEAYVMGFRECGWAE